MLLNGCVMQLIIPIHPQPATHFSYFFFKTTMYFYSRVERNAKKTLVLLYNTL